MHQIMRARFARARSQAGAFDLPSILVGVVVVGILAAGVLAAIFAVIPFAQDKAAQQDLDAVRTAQGVSIAKDGSYDDGTGLESKSYLKLPGTLKVSTNVEKTCFVAVSRSASGNFFFNSSSHLDPQPYTAGVSTDPCLPLGDLVAQLPAPGDTPVSALPVPPGALLVTPTVAVNMDDNHAISGYGTSPDSSVLASWGVPVDAAENWAYPSDGAPFTLSYYDTSTGAYVDYYTQDNAWPDRSAAIVQRGTLVFASIFDHAPGLTAGETAGFGKMLAGGGKLTFLPEGGNGTTATVIMGPASVTTTDPDGPPSDFEDNPSWKPLLTLAQACYGNPDTTRAGTFWMEKATIPAATTDISADSNVFTLGKKDEYRAGVDDIDASVPACTYSADIELAANTFALYSMYDGGRPWQVDWTDTFETEPGYTTTYNELVLSPDSGTDVKLSYFDPATGGFQQFYSAAAGDGTNGTASLNASYMETITTGPNWTATDSERINVRLEFTPGTTEYADRYRVMSQYGGSIEFTAGGKTVTLNVGTESSYGEVDPFWSPPGGGGDAT